MTIRRLEEADLPAVHALLVELSDHLGETTGIDQETICRNGAILMARNDVYDAFVACDPEVIGFISMVFYATLFHRTGIALITELVVSGARRGEGIGAELVARALEEARERGMDELEVGMLKKNAGAIRFYRRNGFDEEYLLLGRHLTP